MKYKELNVTDTFFRNYEKNQNNTLLIAVRWFLILIPIVSFSKIFGKKYELFSNLDWKLIIMVSAVFVIGVFISSIIYLSRPFSPVIKYVLLFTIELDIFLISIDKTFDLYISFVLVPLISCLYLNRKYTLRVLLGCYIIMLLGLFVRAFWINPTFERFDSPKKWFMAYSIGLSIEYVVNMILVLAIIARYSSVVQMDFDEYNRQVKTQNTITKSYVGMLSQKDPGIEEHLQRCSEYVRIICMKLQVTKKYNFLMDDEMLSCMVTGALLHDIGVIAVPDEILTKNEILTAEERRILNTHPVQGERLIRENLRGIKKNYFKVACDMALYHHENWNGTGFPNRLKGTEIPLSARIMAVANAIDTLLTDYPYKPALTFSDAMNTIKNMAGKELDSEIVNVVLEVEDEIYRVARN